MEFFAAALAIGGMFGLAISWNHFTDTAKVKTKDDLAMPIFGILGSFALIISAFFISSESCC